MYLSPNYTVFRLFLRRYRWPPWNMNSQNCLCLWSTPFWQNPYYISALRVANYSTNRAKTRKHAEIQCSKQLLTREVKDSIPCYMGLLDRKNPDNKYNHLLFSQCNIHWKSHVSFQKEADISSSREVVSNKDDSAVKKETVDSHKSLITNSSHDTEVAPQSKQMPDKSSIDSARKIGENNIGSENLPSRIQRYLLGRYSWYLRRFQESLENEMPDTFNMFRIFTVGLKEFIIDFKDFIKLLVQISLPGCTLRTVSHRELELYYHMPGDMVRVFPVLLVSSVPFGQNIAFPIGYWFPRYLLCRHFWDIQQRHEFAVIALKQRLFNARPVFRSLQAVLFTLTDEKLQEKCKRAFYKLGSGIHPTTDEIVSLIPLFQGDPFHINRIRVTHVNRLLRLHGRSVWGRRRRRLRDHARILHLMDAALSREGIDSLTHDQLKSCLFFRGLNPTSMSTSSMREFLESWLRVSREVDTPSYSLLLHLPILLTYNQPSNIVLIY